MKDGLEESIVMQAKARVKKKDKKMKDNKEVRLLTGTKINIIESIGQTLVLDRASVFSSIGSMKDRK